MGFAVIQVPLWGLYELTKVPKDGLIAVSQRINILLIQNENIVFAKFQKIKGVFKPTKHWGPKNSRLKLEWTSKVVKREIDEVLGDISR